MTKTHDSTRMPGGQYRNEHPRQHPSIRQAFKEWRGNKAPTKPAAPVPTETRTSTDFATPPASGLRVTWLGHATSIVEIDGCRFLIDPVWAERASPVSFMGPKRFHEPPLPLEELPTLDAVLLSHDHYDHLDRGTVVALGRTGVRFITPRGVGKRIVRWGVQADQVRELDWWEQVDVGGVTVTSTPSRHFSGRSPFFFDRDKALWCGFALTGPEHRVYYASDTAMFGGFDEIGRRLGPFDAALVENLHGQPAAVAHPPQRRAHGQLAEIEVFQFFVEAEIVIALADVEQASVRDLHDAHRMENVQVAGRHRVRGQIGKMQTGIQEFHDVLDPP